MHILLEAFKHYETKEETTFPAQAYGSHIRGSYYGCLFQWLDFIVVFYEKVVGVNAIVVILHLYAIYNCADVDQRGEEKGIEISKVSHIQWFYLLAL